MNRTKIEWVKNPDGTQGYTWNPLTGCLNHVNGLCKGGGFPCYAYRLANGRLRTRYLANHNMSPFENIEDEDGGDHWQFHDPFYPRFWPERLEELRPIGGIVCELVYPPKTERGIFVCDMSDLFGICIPEQWTQAVLHMIKKWPAHRFYLLTKQPQNLAKWSPFPDNCWVGVTATNNDMAFMAVGYLRQIEAKVKFISFEPLLKPVIRWIGDAEYLFQHLNWVIIGAQTKPAVFPRIEWVEEIVGACDRAGVSVFLKDNLKPILPKEVPTFYTLADPWNEVDQKPVLRQELPGE